MVTLAHNNDSERTPTPVAIGNLRICQVEFEEWHWFAVWERWWYSQTDNQYEGKLNCIHDTQQQMRTRSKRTIFAANFDVLLGVFLCPWATIWSLSPHNMLSQFRTEKMRFAWRSPIFIDAQRSLAFGGVTLRPTTFKCSVKPLLNCCVEYPKTSKGRNIISQNLLGVSHPSVHSGELGARCAQCLLLASLIYEPSYSLLGWRPSIHFGGISNWRHSPKQQNIAQNTLPTENSRPKPVVSPEVNSWGPIVWSSLAVMTHSVCSVPVEVLKLGVFPYLEDADYWVLRKTNKFFRSLMKGTTSSICDTWIELIIDDKLWQEAFMRFEQKYNQLHTLCCYYSKLACKSMRVHTYSRA
jgi:hypothetical protein